MDLQIYAIFHPAKFNLKSKYDQSWNEIYVWPSQKSALFSLHSLLRVTQMPIAQSARALEYTDCFSAEG